MKGNPIFYNTLRKQATLLDYLTHRNNYLPRSSLAYERQEGKDYFSPLLLFTFNNKEKEPVLKYFIGSQKLNNATAF